MKEWLYKYLCPMPLLRSVWAMIVGVWTKPRFVDLAIQPRIQVGLTLGVVRLLLWGPIPFLSLSVGKYWQLMADHDEKDGHYTGKVRGFQFYIGVKAHGDMRVDEGRVYHQYVLTLKECFALRFRNLALLPQQNDQAGA